MPASQCLGRLVRDSKGVGLLSFENGGGMFHIPFRCNTVAANGDLCDACIAREAKTLEKVKGIRGTTIQGMLPAYLNGRVTEPIPFWSRLYDGAWFRLKMESSCTVSEDVMAKAKKAAEVAYEGVAVVEPQPMPGGRKLKTKKVVAVAVAAAVAVPAPAPAPAAAVPTAVPTIAVKKRIKPRPLPVAGVAPVASLSPTELPVSTTREVSVRKIEVDGRNLYLEPMKEKLYDLKFKYIGRLKGDTVVSFPDSDSDV